ncbi:unnamed protein product [Arctia plantaginis]|uniref:Uncharacterized protein n=1 Tax=Arctia plantaginis TaxID=874455 RepID=A0A8S0ZG65_ARCPL|nr:unnamed protein product [Arctia plantaginis]
MSKYNNRGNTRGRSHNSGGNRRDMRDAQRAYDHYNDVRFQQDWNYQPEEFDPNRVQNKQRKPTARSQNFKNSNNNNRGKNQPPKSKEPEQTVVPSTTATPNRDEPLYDIGPHSSLLAAQDVYCQNFEYSGFIPLVNET